MKYIRLLVILLGAVLTGCTYYTPTYYDVSADQWQHMPVERQIVSIYAYNAQQEMLPTQ